MRPTDQCASGTRRAREQGKEVAGSGLPGCAEELVGRSLLGDDAGVEKHDAVRDIPGEGHLVRRHHDGGAASGERAHQLEHLPDELRV